MKLIKKVGSLLLSLVLLVSLLPMAVLAETPAGVPAGYEELDLDWSMAYYNSKFHADLITGETMYFATQKFTIRELPVGSVIVLQPGWTYRPEGWEAGQTKVDAANRPAAVSLQSTATAPSVIEVTEDWWKVKNNGEDTGRVFETRAFYIYKTGTYPYEDLTGRQADVEAAFKIYVAPCDHDIVVENEGTCTKCGKKYLIPEGYEELELQWVQGFYNCTGGTEINSSNVYYSTRKFTKTDLPNGAVIVMQPGWSYRAEGWEEGVSFTPSADRPAAVKVAASDPTSYVVVDDTWWGDFATRVFCVFEGTWATQDLTGRQADVEAAFKIYVPHTHAYGTAWETDADNHWKECACGEKADTAAHTYTNDCDTTCDICGYVRTVGDHTYTNDCDATCDECGATRTPSDHVYANDCDADCNVCGTTRTPADHAYDNDCDADCNVCGATRTPADHVYDNACDADCNECDAERTPADHAYDNACDADCNVCGATRTPADHAYDNACDAACNVCGATRTPADHTYDDACDAACNVCGATRTPADHAYDNACDAACNVCGATRTPSAHAYDNDCDTACNVCGATREIEHVYGQEWESDANGHWHECACGDKSGTAGHTPDRDAATETDPVKCTVCEYIITPELSHTHTYDNACDKDCNVCGATRETEHVYDNACDTACNVCGATREIEHVYGQEWESDDDNHWHECACGEKADTAAHADADIDGKCDICAYDLPVADNPQTGDNSMITLWVTLLCVSAFGIFVTTIYRKKRAF